MIVLLLIMVDFASPNNKDDLAKLVEKANEQLSNAAKATIDGGIDLSKGFFSSVRETLTGVNKATGNAISFSKDLTNDALVEVLRGIIKYSEHNSSTAEWLDSIPTHEPIRVFAESWKKYWDAKEMPDSPEKEEAIDQALAGVIVASEKLGIEGATSVFLLQYKALQFAHKVIAKKIVKSIQKTTPVKDMQFEHALSLVKNNKMIRNRAIGLVELVKPKDIEA